MILVVEHKTSSEDVGIGSDYWKRLTLDPQISNYLVGARALGYDPAGVLYDVLRKPAHRPYEANTKRREPEAPEAYRDRILEDIATRPDHYYQRGVAVRLESEERDAAHDMWATGDLIRGSRLADRWSRNPDSCNQFHRMCDYWPVCSGEATIDDGLRYESTETHVELETKHRLPLLTTSSARTYRACARRYYFAYELGRRPRRKAPALHFGQVIHDGLEAWLTNGRNIEQALASVRPVNYDYDAAKAEAMLRGYDARWLNDALEVVAVEREFVTDLVNPDTGGKSRTFALGGKIDAIVTQAA